MINYWWVTRPKRKLNSVPEVLSTFAELSLNQQWEGQRSSHLSLEDALEQAGLKRQGERRDQGGGKLKDEDFQDILSGCDRMEAFTLLC